MHSCDLIGYLASGLVLAAFGMKDIVRLRSVAIASNVVFLAYGLSLGLVPVCLLHAVLLPLNLWRLAQALGFGDPAVLAGVMRARLTAKRRQTPAQALPSPQATA